MKYDITKISLGIFFCPAFANYFITSRLKKRWKLNEDVYGLTIAYVGIIGITLLGIIL